MGLSLVEVAATRRLRTMLILGAAGRRNMKIRMMQMAESILTDPENMDMNMKLGIRMMIEWLHLQMIGMNQGGTQIEAQAWPAVLTKMSIM
jgi:hypothetical protein